MDALRSESVEQAASASNGDKEPHTRRCVICKDKLSEGYVKPLCPGCTSNIVRQESPSLVEELRKMINQEVKATVSAALTKDRSESPEPPPKKHRRIISDSDSDEQPLSSGDKSGEEQTVVVPETLEEPKRYYFSAEDTDILLNAIRNTMDIKEIQESLNKQDEMFAGLKPRKKRVFPIHSNIKDMILDEWRDPERRLQIPKEFRSRFPFDETDVNLWSESPKIDIQVAKVVKKTSLPFEDASQLKDPIDRKMDGLLRKSWDSAAAALNPNIAATSAARSLFVWLEELENHLRNKSSREDLLKSVPMLKLATAFLVDVSAESVRFAAKNVALTNSVRRALWLKSWEGDNLSKTKLCAIPFEGSLVFGSVLDSILEKAADRKKDFPKEKTPKGKQNFRPYRQNTTPSYRGKGKSGRWSYPKGGKGREFMLNPKPADKKQ
ncbi:uncharacterized protein [Dendropsophus ebraccatus]|uniref:uncharacterized protein n=1 Tax=Dendropsophus ebraccatus TaxID=150705 RepID=UPI0038310882